MDFVPVFSYTDYVSAHIALGRLEEEGITCWLKDENTVTIDPILTNAVGGIKLMVAASQARQAADLLRTLANEHKSLSPCPNCGSLNYELVTSAKKTSNWASVLLGFFITSYAMPVDQVNHCFDCGHEFKPFETPKPETN